MADLRIVDTPLLSTVKGTEKIPTGGEGNFSVSVNQVADFAKLKWLLATEGYVDNAVGNVQADLNLHKNNESNPHNVTKTQVGLGNVDNTADLDKPVSNATQSAIITANSGKADKSYVDSQDQLKADKITTYTKTEVDSEFYGIYQNGAALPYDATMEYVEGAVVVKDGELQKKQGASWVSATNKGYNLDYFVGGKSYPLHAEIMLTNGNIVKSTVPNNNTNPNVDMTGWELDPVALKYTEVASSIKRKLSEVVYDLVLDATWFGAMADHNFRTGAGTVNDTAFQNCINFIGSLGSIRDGGKVKVKVPSGAYQLKHIDIPTFASMGFGLEFVGDGANSTALYFDESYTAKEAITCKMQGVVFKDISLFGSLTSVNIAVGRTNGIVAKLDTSDADIDISFLNCDIRSWNEFAHVYGRGFVFTGGKIAAVAKFSTIHNDTYSDSTPTKLNNIMRHYRIQNNRIDAAGILLTIVGDNTSQQINDVMITDNDFYSLNQLMNYDGHTINGLVCLGNNQLHSFATSMIRGTHLKNSIISSLGLLHRADSLGVPTTDGECVGKVVDLLGDAVGNVISGNVIKNLRENIIHVRGNSSGNVITGNSLSECWSRSNNAVDRVLCLFDGSTRAGNIVKDNSATSSVFSGTFKQTNIPLASLGNNIVKDNISPWAWGDAVQTLYLNVFAGGIDITGSITNNDRICRFTFDGDYVEGVFHITSATTETGAISMSLPSAAISDLPSVTSGFGGVGTIGTISGFTAVGYVPAPIFINAATDKFEFYKLKDMAASLLNWNDGSGTRIIRGTFRYRYK